MIGDQAWRLLSSYNFPPKELRGLTIQITKLEPISKKYKLSASQQSPKNASRDGVSEDEWNGPNDVQPPSGDSNETALPTFSFLEALPPDIRSEIEAQYAKVNKEPDLLKDEESSKDILPIKDVDTKRMARIIQQVAPRNAGSNLDFRAKLNFFEKRRERLDVPRSVLLKLGIDPEIFWQLSINDQREQLDIFRTRH